MQTSMRRSTFPTMINKWMSKWLYIHLLLQVTRVHSGEHRRQYTRKLYHSFMNHRKLTSRKSWHAYTMNKPHAYIILYFNTTIFQKDSITKGCLVKSHGDWQRCVGLNCAINLYICRFYVGISWHCRNITADVHYSERVREIKHGNASTGKRTMFL